MEAGKGQAFQVLIEVTTKPQALQTGRECHGLQALVELMAKLQIFQGTWEGHTFQGLIEFVTES